MGKGRRIKAHRQADSKRPINIDISKELLFPFMQGLLLTILIAFLFYRRIWGCAIGIFVIPFWMNICINDARKKKKAKLLVEFKEYMMLIVASLQTGYSFERALLQSEHELKRLYPKDSVLIEYVHIMNQKISMNVQLEKAFLEFANELDIEEAMSLSEIISFAKRSGGDYGKNIRQTATKIEDNLSIKQEIETITTEKRLELKVMCVMPMGILAYISLTSKDFIAPLYGNLLGVALMSICLIGYALLIMLGRRIIEIRV